MERSQVIWRLANCRVAAAPRSATSARTLGVARVQALVQCFPHLPVAHAADGGQAQMQVRPLAQPPDFIDEALVHHLREAQADALVQPGALGGFQ